VSDAGKPLRARVRWAWTSGPATLAVVLLYLFIGFPWALVSVAMATGSFVLGGAVGFLPLGVFFLTQGYSPEMSVGADGVFFRWLGWTRFIPYRDIRSVVTSDEGVPHQDSGSPEAATRSEGDSVTYLQIDLRSGKSVRMRTGGLGADGGRFERGAEIVMRIRAGIEAAASDTSGSRDDVRELACGERKAAAWLNDLGRRARGRGYRDGAVDREELLGIVESNMAAPTARVGAAAILRNGGLQDEERTRLRIAAESSVAPNVRVALEAASDAELEERAFEEAATGVARAERR
jgi:hypothetical protein